MKQIISGDTVQYSFSPNDGAAVENIRIQYICPWTNYKDIYPTVDLILSQAVLEHVDLLEDTYGIMNNILVPGGWMSHEIDFKCHGITYKWNGHWAHSDVWWNIVRGKKVYLINREPLSTHLTYGNKEGLKVKEVVKLERHDGIAYSRRNKRFKNVSEQDFIIASAFIVIHKSSK